MKNQIAIYQVILICLILSFTMPAEAGIGKRGATSTTQAATSQEKPISKKATKIMNRKKPKSRPTVKSVLSSVFGNIGLALLPAGLISLWAFPPLGILLISTSMVAAFFALVLGFKDKKEQNKRGKKRSVFASIGKVFAFVTFGLLTLVGLLHLASSSGGAF